MVSGVDVSSSDGIVNWKAIWRAGHRFAYVKASEGLTWHDPRFLENWSGAGLAGLLRGAYHYARPQPDRTGEEEAAFFCSVLGRVGAARLGQLPPALDLEVSQGLGPAETHDWAAAFVDELRRSVGRAPVIYTGGFWKTQLGDPDQSWGCPLWLAQYGTSDPVLPAAWTRWTIWQYTDSGHVADAPGKRFDLNRFNGSYDELQALSRTAETSSTALVKADPVAIAPVTTQAPAFGGRVLELGVEGHDVRAWQRQMRLRGFPLSADGLFGSESAQACRQLQLFKELPADGRVDQVTWDATWVLP
jgi:lysozyme